MRHSLPDEKQEREPMLIKQPDVFGEQNAESARGRRGHIVYMLHWLFLMQYIPNTVSSVFCFMMCKRVTQGNSKTE